MSRRGKEVSKKEGGVDKPEDWLSSTSREFAEGEWLLTVKEKDSNKGVSDVGWFYVDRVVKVDKGDPANEGGYGYQVIQFWRTGITEEPFKIDAAFKRVLRKTWGDLKSRTTKIEGKKAPKALIEGIINQYS